MQLTRKRIRGSISQSGVNRIDKTQPSPEFAHASQLKKKKKKKKKQLPSTSIPPGRCFD